MTRTPFQIVDPQGYLYIVTDSHLDQTTAPYQEFIEMLDQLPAPHTLVCLGDLFKIWLALPKFWAAPHVQVMQAFQRLRDRQVKVIFVAGNRELLLPRKLEQGRQAYFPFTHLAHEDFYLTWGTQRYGFRHGDTINRLDKNYLLWRAFSHSRPFEMLFRGMPGPVARYIAHQIEALLSDTNQEFKMHFPAAEVERFAQTVLPEVDGYFVGHFHVDKLIQPPGHASFLRVVPDWLSQRTVLQIDPQGQIHSLIFPA